MTVEGTLSSNAKPLLRSFPEMSRSTLVAIAHSVLQDENVPGGEQLIAFGAKVLVAARTFTSPEALEAFGASPQQQSLFVNEIHDVFHVIAAEAIAEISDIEHELHDAVQGACSKCGRRTGT